MNADRFFFQSIDYFLMEELFYHFRVVSDGVDTLGSVIVAWFSEGGS